LAILSVSTACCFSGTMTHWEGWPSQMWPHFARPVHPIRKPWGYSIIKTDETWRYKPLSSLLLSHYFDMSSSNVWFLLYDMYRYLSFPSLLAICYYHYYP
jgi:hypothetical protein